MSNGRTAEHRLRRLELGRLDADDWRHWERAIDRRGVVIDRSRGHAHPLYADMIYPLDYGHVPGIAAADGEDLDVFVGSARTGLVGVIALAHAPVGVADPKLLLGVAPGEARAILAFLDRGDPGPALDLVWRHPR